MGLELSRSQGRVYHFKKAPLAFQQTFKTTLQDLPRFVATILSPFRVDSASITIDQIVFDPTTLLHFLATYDICRESLVTAEITATGEEVVKSLLVAAFSDWVDFLFTPSTNRFALYADHDERTTAFAASQTDLELIKTSMTRAGYRSFDNYRRF